MGNRLLSAVVPYEETGWYDGQLWVKPPEVHASQFYSYYLSMNGVSQGLNRSLGGCVIVVTSE